MPLAMSGQRPWSSTSFQVGSSAAAGKGGLLTLDVIRLLGTVVVGGLVIEVATRVLARVHPPSYFGLSEVIRGFDRDLSMLGFAVRLSIPFLCGAIVGLLNPEAPGVAGGVAALLGALLVIWPPLVHDHLIPYGASERKAEVRIVYVLYVSSFLLLGLGGGAIAGFAAEMIAPSDIARWFQEIDLPAWAQILMCLFGGTFGAALLGGAKRMATRLRENDS